ncbi:MAG: thioredoxin family protein [Balneolaceae bacterium]
MNITTMDVITRQVIDKAYTYSDYRTLVNDLLDQDKTTGDNHSEAMIHYTKMNVHRMNRLDKRAELSESLINELKKVKKPMIWLVLTEAWCGDVAQNIPVINKMAVISENIELRLILRDENLEIMDQFLTNGKSRSIPKLICLHKDTLEILGTWGPRPEKAAELYDSLRNTSDLEYKEVAERLHKWYADNKHEDLQKEFEGLLKKWNEE